MLSPGKAKVRGREEENEPTKATEKDLTRKAALTICLANK